MLKDALGSSQADRRYRLLGWTLVPAALIAVWEVSARLVGEYYIFPPASQVAEELLHPFREHYAMGSLLRNTMVSLLRVAFGFAAAAAAAVPLGLAMGSTRRLRGLLEPLLELLRPLCPIAWLPFAIAVFRLYTVPQLFGVDYSRTIFDQVQLGMVFILFWGAFFPILVNTLDGAAGVRRSYLLLARTLGAGRLQSFLKVRLPAAMPSVLTGLRQGIATCWFVIIAAEMVPGSDSGIGHLLMEAGDLSDMDVVVAAMVIIGGIGALFNFALVLGLGRFVRWHGKEA